VTRSWLTCDWIHRWPAHMCDCVRLLPSTVTTRVQLVSAQIAVTSEQPLCVRVVERVSEHAFSGTRSEFITMHGHHRVTESQHAPERVPLHLRPLDAMIVHRRRLQRRRGLAQRRHIGAWHLRIHIRHKPRISCSVQPPGAGNQPAVGSAAVRARCPAQGTWVVDCCGPCASAPRRNHSLHAPPEPTLQAMITASRRVPGGKRVEWMRRALSLRWRGLASSHLPTAVMREQVSVSAPCSSVYS
jgi:hypothetical protein